MKYLKALLTIFILLFAQYVFAQPITYHGTETETDPIIKAIVGIPICDGSNCTALTYTPENVSNKKISLTDNSDTYYPSQKAVKTAVDAKQNALGYTPVDAADWTTHNNYPSVCTGVNFVQGIGDTLTCAQPSNVTGNAATCTAFASSPTVCGEGYAPRGVNTSGNAQNCTAYVTSETDPIIKALNGVVKCNGSSCSAFTGTQYHVACFDATGQLVDCSSLSIIELGFIVPTSDNTFYGLTIPCTVGETVAQWNVLYAKNNAGALNYYKYDANGTNKLQPARVMATTAITSGNSGTCLVKGTVRNDGWAMTTNQDEGKKVYASGTAGAITLTQPATTGDEVQILGYVLEENIIFFDPDKTLIEIP